MKALLELDSHLAVSISHTTRAPRGQEQHGREYWFVPEPEFRAMVERGEFFEWAAVHGNLYGTSRKAIEERTPFAVRHVGITNLQYPDIITKAQEAAAERREAIQQEEAQTQVSAARLERELREARMQRAIEKEKAETEAVSQATLAQSVDARVLELRKLENQRAWIEKWDGKLPTTTLGDTTPMVKLK